MTKHRITLKDIAEKLGITVTTVSKALKDYPDISEDTKKKVHALAKKLNYQPDSQAVALRGKGSKTIGLIIPEIVHYFFSSVINGIMNHAESNGYRVLITLSNNRLEMEKKQVNLLFSTKVDGVLVSLTNETKGTKHFDILKEYDIPVVMFDKVDNKFHCNKVTIDDCLGGYNATKHLIDSGCQRIAHIRGPKKPLNSIGRFEGYKKALIEANMVFDPSLVKECTEVVYDEGYQFCKELLKLPKPPDGIFAVTDQVGVGALNALKDAKLNIPEDMKIVGFSDSQIAQVSQPPLTTIHQPGYEIGETAAKLLIEDIELRKKDPNHMFGSKQIVLDTHLIKRGST
ncbi:transcriptional regulator, LacI family [Ekhidna lutea]|uniref:Transcriptional regulator, LacI family n=1 Tax=Ekhidna lutea TaxID=447679 RepID=A0A239GVS7_EKHLU|nr:LacI family DNA-binding transcriptional regulator [Ekhidna lutea]SNS73071.1 transcriptional regulator, LacI family [Ekhidna lutea]